MLNKVCDIFMTLGVIVHTTTYSEDGLDYIDYIIEYRKILYLLTLKRNKKGFKCISISELKE